MTTGKRTGLSMPRRICACRDAARSGQIRGSFREPAGSVVFPAPFSAAPGLTLMALIRSRSRIVLFGMLMAVAAVVPANAAGTRLAAADEPARLVPPLPLPERPLSDADLDRINQTIAERGSEIRLNREVTSQLGVTRGDELLLSRGIGVKDERGDIHEFEPLADGKGYLILKLSPALNTIYWVNKDFVLTAALSRVPGAPALALPLAEARDGAARELAYWAAFARGPSSAPQPQPQPQPRQ
jgi:hypothetical protein